MGNNGKKKRPRLAKIGWIPEADLAKFMSAQYGVPAIDLSEFDVDMEVIALIAKDVAKKHCCLPINRAGASLIVAMGDPSNTSAIDNLKFITGCNIEVVHAPAESIEEAIERYYDDAEQAEK